MENGVRKMKFIDFICGAWAVFVLAYILFTKVEGEDKKNGKHSGKDK